MSTKHKAKKPQRTAAKDAEDRRKFMTVLALATLALMVLMYFIFAG